MCDRCVSQTVMYSRTETSVSKRTSGLNEHVDKLETSVGSLRERVHACTCNRGGCRVVINLKSQALPDDGVLPRQLDFLLGSMKVHYYHFSRIS